MCDTIYVPADMTKNGYALFGKNSDRDPNEAHLLEYFSRQTHQKDETVQCTYISIPQVPVTNGVMLAKPFWIWGAEMGANEFGVVIGNEAVFTRIPYQKKNGLTGMDLLRLGLERGATAYDALMVIVHLLEEYGQGGNCGFLHPFYYHNSFLIADPKEAWVLETADKQWAAEKVKGVRTISNAITITNKWDLASEDLVKFAVEKGWCRSEEDFSFSKCYSDPLITYFSDARGRQVCSTTRLAENTKDQAVDGLMKILRTHQREDEARWSPDDGFTGADICMHAGVGPVRISETTGSMISELRLDDQIHWFTGSAAPCTGIFKPVWFRSGLPNMGQTPTGTYDPESLWWMHEQLHREVILDYQHRISLYKIERDQLEASFIADVENLYGSGEEERKAFSQQCFDKSKSATKNWLKSVQGEPVKKGVGALYKKTRGKFNTLAKLPCIK